MTKDAAQRSIRTFYEAVNVDGTIVPTTGECKEGMDISYNGQWGYHPLVISLAATREPIFIVNRSGNVPSHTDSPIGGDANNSRSL
jgi:hypothetical protein